MATKLFLASHFEVGKVIMTPMCKSAASMTRRFDLFEKLRSAAGQASARLSMPWTMASAVLSSERGRMADRDEFDSGPKLGRTVKT